MTPLARWLQQQMDDRHLSQRALSDRSGVALGTINKTLKSDYIPKIETLFRLAESLDTERLDILIIAGHLTRADQLPPRETHHLPFSGHHLPPREPHHLPSSDDRLEWQLIQEFRSIPKQYRQDAIDQVRLISRLLRRPTFRIIPDDTPEAPVEGSVSHELTE